MENVIVAIRIKPPAINATKTKCLDVINDGVPILYITGRHQPYVFDTIFDEETDQNEIFSGIVNPLIGNTLLGYNCTIFAYGQSGTGKTYTMGSDMKEMSGEHAGIIKRVFDAIFARTSNLEGTEMEISVCEIYQEKVFDLLGDGKTPVCVKGMNNVALTQMKITDQSSIEKLLVKSSKQRHTAKTKQNPCSSRSHAVFTAYVNVRDGKGTRCAKLNMVDLAGCESVKKAGSTNNQFHEAVKINMSLLSVRSVINALSLGNTCVPYRESMLTRVLHDSLSRRSYITLIACVSSNIADLHETMQTLEFATKTRKVKSKPEMNSVLGHGYGTTLCNFKTPLKRSNPFLRTSTAIKKPKRISSSTILSENLENPNFSTLISPIAEKVVSKLGNRYGHKYPLATKDSEFYNTIRTMIQEEVNSRTMSTTKLSSDVNLRNDDRTEILPPTELDLSDIPQITTIAVENKENVVLAPEIVRRSTSFIETREGLSKISRGNNELNLTGIGSISPIPVENKKNDVAEITENNSSITVRKKRMSNDALKSNNSMNNNNSQLSIEENIIKNKTSPIVHNGETKENETPTTSFCFNLPSVAIQRITVKEKLSPILRRSVRLSLKKRQDDSLSISEKDDFEFLRPSHRVPVNPQRRSIRIAQKQMNSTLIGNSDTDKSISYNDTILSNESSRINKKRNTKTTIDDSKTTLSDRRRSVRVSVRSADTSNMSSSRSASNISHGSPRKQRKDMELHKMNILRILNNGNMKEIQKLHTIGAKTAEQIVLFRRLNGSLKAVSDLKQILYRGNSYDRFLTSNCLNFELDATNE